MNTPKNEAPPETRPALYVGVGASAGGLEAIEAFFTNMRPDSGLAFIVVQHLSPDYKSLMAELLSKKTQMPVRRAEDGMVVAPDCVYLIPPKKNLKIFHGKLLLSAPDHLKGLNLPIDIFLRSLAEDQGEKAVGIILSGTGSDGMRGVRTIKEFGGMVMVQDETSAKFDGMPRSAISTGLADFILPPDEMPEQLLSYLKHPYVSKTDRAEAAVTDEEALTRLYAEIRDKFKLDFTYYKLSTISRRIERRMTVNQINDIREYVSYLQSYPGEAATLYRELLIGVTSFFRDKKAFDELGRKYLPELLKVDPGREVRFWVAGCSTGEEAYTLAILVKERLEEMEAARNVKIFATDVDRDAIVFAGNGLYPASIAADLSTPLLSKYFYKKDDNFQVTRALREMVVFAQHNLIKDPPFTNIDLITCRNLLIYLQPVLQKKVFEFFNFSLNPDGILFLGASETAAEMSDFFGPLNTKYKIYRSRGRVGQISEDVSLTGIEANIRKPRLHFPGVRPAGRAAEGANLLERLAQTVSGDYVPLSIVVNEQMEVVYVLGNAEGYFRLPSGLLKYDIAKMSARDIAVPLTTGIQKAFKSGEEIRYSGIRLKHGDDARHINLRIKPLYERKGQAPMVAAFFEEVRRDAAPATEAQEFYDLDSAVEQHIKDLEQELQFTRENLQATIEELETANEELQATNQELLASNEELQSTNEELQSTNEELNTVNAQYQMKIIELTEANNDVVNLLTATRIGFLLLDENLEIRRFSPLIGKIFRIIDADVGRPVTHISHDIRNADPVKIIRSVQKSEEAAEKEVRTRDGQWYLLRVFPYSIGPRQFSGVVVKFINITQIKTAEAARETDRRRYDTLFNLSPAMMHSIDEKGRLLDVNEKWLAVMGFARDEVIGKKSTDFMTDASRERAEKIELPRFFETGSVKDAHYQMKTKSGKIIDVLLSAAAETDAGGNFIRSVAVLQEAGGGYKP